MLPITSASAFHNKSNAKKHVPRCSQGSKTCGKLSGCQKNEQKPIKRSGRQTNWKRRHLAVLRRLAKRNRSARTSANPLWVVAFLISFDVLELLTRSRTLNLNCAAVNSGKNEKPPDGGEGQPGADEQSGRTFPAHCWNL